MTSLPKIIEIVISPTGQAQLQTKGFAGAECHEASRALEAALGLRLVEYPTAEFHVAARTEERNRERS
jgi:hypothetical protein